MPNGVVPGVVAPQPHWFLSTRVESHGGSVAPEVKVLDADRPGATSDSLLPELIADIHGRDVFFATHGFEVNQPDGTAHLDFWLDNIRLSLAASQPATLGDPVTIGILWPGDATIPFFVDYIVEGHEALASGDLLAPFLNDNFTGAVSLSFASHSLGARVVLQTIRGLAPSFSVRRILMMAGAIDNTCLIDEYKDVTARLAAQTAPAQISILASVKDEVLAWAFPLGNPIQRIIDHSHPYFRAALGHKGPAKPSSSSPPLQSGWQIPEDFDYGHHNYLPGEPLPAIYPGDVDIPPSPPATPGKPILPPRTPDALNPDKTPGVDPNEWKPAWSSGFASTRYRRA